MERLFAPARAGRLSVLEVGSLRGFLRRGESVEYGDEGERGLVIGFDTAESLTARDKALLDEGPCAGAIYVRVRKYSLCAAGSLSVLPKLDLTAGVMLVLPAVIKSLLFVVHGNAVVHMPVPLVGVANAFVIRKVGNKEAEEEDWASMPGDSHDFSAPSLTSTSLELRGMVRRLIFCLLCGECSSVVVRDGIGHATAKIRLRRDEWALLMFMLTDGHTGAPSVRHYERESRRWVLDPGRVVFSSVGSEHEMTRLEFSSRCSRDGSKMQPPDDAFKKLEPDMR